MSPTSVLNSALMLADTLVYLSYIAAAMAAGVFVTVAGLLIYAVFAVQKRDSEMNLSRE